LTAGAARIILPFYLAYLRGQKKAVTVAAKSGKFTTGKAEKVPVPLRRPRESGKRENCERDFISR